MSREWLSGFYRATLCVSVIFAVARCLSVCLSVTLVYCVNMAEDIDKLLSRSGGSVILVFFDPSAGTQFQGEPPSAGAQSTRGLENFATFG